MYFVNPASIRCNYSDRDIMTQRSTLVVSSIANQWKTRCLKYHTKFLHRVPGFSQFIMDKTS